MLLITKYIDHKVYDRGATNLCFHNHDHLHGLLYSLALFLINYIPKEEPLKPTTY